MAKKANEIVEKKAKSAITEVKASVAIKAEVPAPIAKPAAARDIVHLYLGEESKEAVKTKNGSEGFKKLEAFVKVVNADGSIDGVVTFSNGTLFKFAGVQPEGSQAEGKDFYRTVAE